MDDTYFMDLVTRLDAALCARDLWLVTAESCTGGMLSHVITNLAGVSRTFLGGIISYDNWLKQNLLGVQEITLINHGAVSPQTALEMARGAREASASPAFPLERLIGVSVTGIAGPGGGSAAKPLGLVWIGADSHWGSETLRYVASGDRLENKAQFTEQALLFLLRHLEKIPFPADAHGNGDAD
ncbi:MAG: CinA family protein [Anaerolineaceae bacterium]